ncbi:hypothetical protein K438DRAFT_1471265, partial [Mycena galopus ATCC 62051]
LMGNIFMFKPPVAKVYNTLPLSREEFADVFASVFLGSARPTESDFARLLDTLKMKHALDWLKLNHVNYESL